MSSRSTQHFIDYIDEIRLQLKEEYLINYLLRVYIAF